MYLHIVDIRIRYNASQVSMAVSGPTIYWVVTIPGKGRQDSTYMLTWSSRQVDLDDSKKDL